MFLLIYVTSNGDIQSLGGYPAASATVVYSTSGVVTTGTAVSGTSGTSTTSGGTNTGVSTSDSTSSTGGKWDEKRKLMKLGNEGSSSDAARVAPVLALLAAYFL